MFFQAEDGIRDLVRSRGLGDVYKRQVLERLQAEGLVALPGGGAEQDMARTWDDTAAVLVIKLGRTVAIWRTSTEPNARLRSAWKGGGSYTRREGGWLRIGVVF